MIGENSTLRAIYRMDKEDPVGFNTWQAGRNQNIITLYMPNSIAEAFVREAMKKSELTLRVKGDEVETYTYDLNGLSEAVKKLTCIDSSKKDTSG